MFALKRALGAFAAGDLADPFERDLIVRPFDDGWHPRNPQHARDEGAVNATTKFAMPASGVAATPLVLTHKDYQSFVIPGTAVNTGDTSLPTALLTGDQQPGDTSTQTSITVDGDHLISTIDSIGDTDFFSVELTAGQFYEIGQYLVVGGPSGIPLTDAFLELYDSSGQLITSADGGGPNTPSGLDALLTYQATYTGTYYVSAAAYDQDASNGAGGDGVGDYEVFVRTADADPYAYRPFYDPDSPLYSIDWGTQIAHTTRNPDGDNGTRDNGVPSNGVFVDAATGIAGKNVVTYYFAKAGELYIDEDPTTPGSTDTMIAKGMEQWEKDAFRLALDQYEHVADLVYVEVDNRAQADFQFVTYLGTPGAGASLLGRMSPPGEENAGQAEFNAGDVRWTQEGLQQGGFYFPTLLHEFGHGHGMAHPHDNGGHSGVMPGGDGGTAGIGGGLGAFDLSQQVFTIMSYNDGWQTSPYGGPSSGDLTGLNSDPFGWMGTLAALDIAVIQDKYGVNEDYAKGDDIYTLKDVNDVGAFYSTIWDGGGTDEIRYDGAKNATIDLRAATLQYEQGGGGWMSYAYGIYGGFTIANGVTIENAAGGAGADTLIGNDAANVLNGGDGDDVIRGNAGADNLNGGVGADLLAGDAGADKFDGGDGVDTGSYADSASGVTAYLSGKAGLGGDAQGDTYMRVENLTGSAFADKLYGDSGDNTLHGGDGADVLDGGAGTDYLYGDAGDDTLLGNSGDDFIYGSQGADKMNGGAGVDAADYSASDATVIVNLQSGSASGGYAEGDTLTNIESLVGSAFSDTLYGRNNQANTIDGGDGADVLWGGSGADTFVFHAGQGAGDIVLDFSGNGALPGDSLLFEGYGTADEGAHFTQIDTTHWEIVSADGLVHDIITLANGALVDQTDFVFA